jgi:hypothetical protein
MIAVAGLLIVWAGLVWHGAAEARANSAQLIMRSEALERALKEAREEIEQGEKTLRALRSEEARQDAARTPEQRMARDVLALLNEVGGRDFGAALSGMPQPESPSGKMGSVCFPELMADADYARLSAAYYRYEMEERYAPLFADLALESDKRATLLGFLVEKKLVEFEGEGVVRQRLIAEANGQPLDKRKVDAVIKKEIDAEIRATLGDAVFEAYTDFERTYWTRAPVEKFATRLRLHGGELNQKAADELRELLLSGAKADQRTRGSSAREFSKESVERARDFLTAEQWVVFNQIEAEKKARTEFFMRVSRSLLKQTGDGRNLKRINAATDKAAAADAVPASINTTK